MATFTNCTPHDVSIVDIFGNVVFTAPGMGARAPRVDQDMVNLGTHPSGIPLTAPTFGAVDITLFPDGDCIVSLIIAQAIKAQFPDQAHRFFVPQGAIRGGDGKIIGCTSLCPATHV
jgi:hypothetical protein